MISVSFDYGAGSMFIFRFDTYLFPKVAQVIFIILAVLIILGTIISAGGSLFAPYVGLMTRYWRFSSARFWQALWASLFLRFFFEFSLVILLHP